VWSGEWAYTVIANANGVKGTTFSTYGPCPPPAQDCFVDGPVSLDVMVGWHRAWAAYVTGIGPAQRPGSDAPPIAFGRQIFTEDEYRHMADVRSVFRGAETAAVLALGVLAFRLIRARRDRRALRLVRDGAVVAAAMVTGIGVAAALAFDRLFLLFHEVFFPQGNFLFDPATSNLLRLYPDWYWQGVTAGVAVSFVALALIAAGGTHLALRRYTRRA